ncbi:M28 family peptidase [Saccharolobus solfataricus]|uniref:Peptidase M28 domain-containing protein n=3 Tax=Saccharolobus solfataricus TaxID=2287 RepID=Q7LXL7_SACS2|nr:M28 family peptidase [Saccharolobus solfataricus]AAK41023.1 Hypothetical protein SSO0725 [Saccharolobus solfataricus P2]AKA74050.1 M28 family peptidase [Saccharolobus solfataricus]AKA76747.1 M28 family peptidase [Saccharolobus solfataricus]AKA79441.1 M28 family peptidase [Saccharolobus solfataricus]AZF68529.1 M28 family peptidase [Saccharolobus solfataricus]
MLLHYLKTLSNYGEIITGSKNETKLVKEIRKILEDNSDEIRLIPIRVLNWEQKELIFECESKLIDAISLPYSLSTEIEADVVDNFKDCNGRNLIKVRIQNLYEINKLYIEAVENNCLGIIFSLDNEKRKFMIKYGDLLSHKPSYPPPIPAFYVKENDFPYIKGKCRISLKTDLNPFATGYIVEAIRNSRNENKIIHITAHHDHWFIGERDNLLAVALLRQFRSNIYETHLISFTAEESGSFNFSTFSWSHGSREFLKNYKNVDDILLNINMDNISEESLVLKTVPGLLELSRKYFKNVVESPEIYSDGYSYIKAGIPSITIESLGNIHYHGEYDIIETDKPNVFSNVTTILDTINKIINENIEYKTHEMRDQLKNNLWELPAELKSYLVNVKDILDKNYTEVYRKIVKLYGGILAFNQPYSKVELFHKIKGLNIARKNDVCIEDLGCIKRLRNDEIYNRFYLYYINELKELITTEYINQLYFILKKFF